MALSMHTIEIVWVVMVESDDDDENDDDAI